MSFSDIFKVDEIKKENELLKQKVSNLANELNRSIQNEINHKQQNEILKNQIGSLATKLNSLGYDEYEKAKTAIDGMNKEISDATITIASLREKITQLELDAEKNEKRANTALNKLNRSKEIYKSIEYAISNFFESTPELDACKISAVDSNDLDELLPSVILKLHCMDMRDLRKAYNDNNKKIDEVLESYHSRYTTKANKAIYELMVIALRAELQNILYNLKYEKLEKSIYDLKNVTAKYLAIAAHGNQSIAGTMTKFIGEIEYLFINAIKIEYNYYVKKEQAKQEQLAIKEQMRQEAEERRALEEERKKIAAEESKYESEIEKLQEKIKDASDEEKTIMQTRIIELQTQLSDVIIKKENITSLQNGKAGNIYIISNLGSFGDKMFKVGMTRRLNPQDRIDELGDASVPFKFDVHSFIFSDDAVGLETEMHRRLSDKRVNKVNMRKEFFYSTIDELEALVNEISPTAEFNKTMLAEEFRQSQSTNESYSSDFEVELFEEE